jgi:hypothetical protein
MKLILVFIFILSILNPSLYADSISSDKYSLDYEGIHEIGTSSEVFMLNGESENGDFIFIDKSVGKGFLFSSVAKEKKVIFELGFPVSNVYFDGGDIYLTDGEYQKNGNTSELIEVSPLTSLIRVSLSKVDDEVSIKKINIEPLLVNDDIYVTPVLPVKNIFIYNENAYIVSKNRLIKIDLSVYETNSTSIDEKYFDIVYRFSDDISSISGFKSKKLLFLTSSFSDKIYSYNVEDNNISTALDGREFLSSEVKKRRVIRSGVLYSESNDYLMTYDPVDSFISLFEYNDIYSSLDLIFKKRLDFFLKNDFSDFSVFGDKASINNNSGFYNFSVSENGLYEEYQGSYSISDFRAVVFDKSLSSYLALSADKLIYFRNDDSLGFSSDNSGRNRYLFKDNSKMFNFDFKAKDLKYFEIDEFFTVNGNKVEKDFPSNIEKYNVCELAFVPDRYWCNIIETAEDLDILRHHLATSINIESPYELCKSDSNEKNLFHEISFSSDKNIRELWNEKSSDEFLTNKFGDRLVFSEDGKSGLIKTVSEKLWVYVGQQTIGENDFNSNYFNIKNSKDFSLHPQKPLTTMNLRESFPYTKEIGDVERWVFSDRVGTLNKNRLFSAPNDVPLINITYPSLNKVRYWAGGIVDVPPNISDKWIVIVASSISLNDVVSAKKDFESRYPEYKFTLFKNDDEIYAVSIGSELNQAEAKQLVFESKCSKLSTETLMALSIEKNWRELE